VSRRLTRLLIKGVRVPTRNIRKSALLTQIAYRGHFSTSVVEPGMPSEFPCGSIIESNNPSAETLNTPDFHS
jgi:hypothetical protein